MKMLIVGVSALTILAACGGGGGGGNSSGGSDIIPFKSFQESPDDGTIRVNGQTVSAAYTYDPNTDTIQLVGTPTSTKDSVLDVTLKNELIEQVKLSKTGNNVAFNTKDGDYVYDEDGALLLEGSNGEKYAIFVAGDQLNYQTFGAWITGYDSGSGSASVGSFGARTDAQSMPQNGTASYDGAAVGIVAAEGSYTATASDITVDADFDRSSVEMASTGTQRVDIESGEELVSAPDLDFVGSGDIDGSTFKAGIESRGNLLRGEANGQFYGPNAEEVGGTFSASGKSTFYSGAFGAKQ